MYNIKLYSPIREGRNIQDIGHHLDNKVILLEVRLRYLKCITKYIEESHVIFILKLDKNNLEKYKLKHSLDDQLSSKILICIQNI